MPPAFPNRHISEEEAQGQRWFQHIFILQPPLQGATVQDFVQYANSLKSAVEVTGLDENDEIPRRSLDGQEFTVQSVKDVVKEIISNNPIQWVRECVGVTLMHHPDKRGKLVSTLSTLPVSTRPGQKILSVLHGDDVYALNVQLHENEFMRVDGLYVWLDNPADPVAEHVVQGDRGESLTIRDVYDENNEKMELFAMISFVSNLLSNTDLAISDLKCRYEPLGKAFPDFDLTICDEEWAFEVTSIQSGMVSYLRISEGLDRETFDKAAQLKVTDDKIITALRKALDVKTRKRNDCQIYSRACLLLVDIVDSVDPDSATTWKGADLSAFEAVVLVKLDGRIIFIKGEDDFTNRFGR